MKSLIGVMMTTLMFLIATNPSALVYAQEGSSMKNDLVFEVQGLRTSPVIKDFQISGEVWEKICPSNQCQIEEDEYANITTPDADDDTPQVLVTLYFYVHDNITNKDLTPLQKKNVERYDLTVSCVVDSGKNVIEKANNLIYKCSSERTDLRKYDGEKKDPTFFFKIEGTYDTQADLLMATGKYVR